MKPETEQTLATLEVLIENELLCLLPDNHDSYWQSFLWDSAERGEFNVLNLLQAEGWMHSTDTEVAVESWQQLEQRGAATEDYEDYVSESVEWDNLLEPEAYQHKIT